MELYDLKWDGIDLSRFRAAGANFGGPIGTHGCEVAGRRGGGAAGAAGLQGCGACYPSFGKPDDGLGFAPVMCEHSHGSTGICGIVYIDGGVWGGAVEVVLACDIIIATPQSSFAVTPAKLGVPYNVSGMMTFMSAASLRIVKELAFTAAPISAERAERVGMINHVVEAGDLDAFTLAMAATIAANAPLSIAVMKEQLRVLAGAKPLTPRGFEKVQGLRRVVYDSQDYQEGIRAFKEKRKPRFTGT